MKTHMCSTVDAIKQMLQELILQVQTVEDSSAKLGDLVKLVGLYKTVLDIEDRQLKLDAQHELITLKRQAAKAVNEPLSESEWELLEECVTRWRDAPKKDNKDIDK